MNKKGPQSYIQSANEEIFTNPTMTVAARKRNINDHGYPTDMIIGFCLPSSCSAHDLQVAIAQDIGRFTFQLAKKPDDTLGLYSLATTTHERYCHTENKIKEQSSFDVLSISFM